MVPRFRSLCIGAALLVMAAAAPWAHADPITYYYTGSAFTTYNQSLSCPTSSCSLTGSMTLAGPLGDNAFSDPTVPISFSFSDGFTTFDNTNSTLINSLFATNSSGQITAWVISGELDSNQFTWYQSANWPGNPVGDLVQVYAEGSASSAVAGSWSFTPPNSVPEPASWTLLAAGLLLLLALGKPTRAWTRR